MKMYYAGHFATRAEALVVALQRRAEGFISHRIVARSDGRFDLFYL